MNRKQEVIKILVELVEAGAQGHVILLGVYYNRIDRLIRREFPEEEFRKVGRRYRQARDKWWAVVPYKSTSIEYTFDQMIADYKRFWEGHTSSLAEIVSNIPPEKRRDLDEKIDKAIREQDKPQGTCRKCGGSGLAFVKDGKPYRVPEYIDEVNNCPDCGGTREAPTDLTDTAKVVIPGRRSGNERRKVESARRIHPDRRKTG